MFPFGINAAIGASVQREADERRKREAKRKSELEQAEKLKKLKAKKLKKHDEECDCPKCNRFEP